MAAITGNFDLSPLLNFTPTIGNRLPFYADFRKEPINVNFDNTLGHVYITLPSISSLVTDVVVYLNNVNITTLGNGIKITCANGDYINDQSAFFDMSIGGLLKLSSRKSNGTWSVDSSENNVFPFALGAISIFNATPSNPFIIYSGESSVVTPTISSLSFVAQPPVSGTYDGGNLIVAMGNIYNGKFTAVNINSDFSLQTITGGTQQAFVEQAASQSYLTKLTSAQIIDSFTNGKQVDISVNFNQVTSYNNKGLAIACWLDAKPTSTNNSAPIMFPPIVGWFQGKNPRNYWRIIPPGFKRFLS